jgi:hypothetical protein
MSFSKWKKRWKKVLKKIQHAMYSIIDIAFVDGDSRLREKEYR